MGRAQNLPFGSVEVLVLPLGCAGMGVMKAIMVTVGNPSWLAERERRQFEVSLGGRWQANVRRGEAGRAESNVRGSGHWKESCRRDDKLNMGARATAARPFPGGGGSRPGRWLFRREGGVGSSG